MAMSKVGRRLKEITWQLLTAKYNQQPSNSFDDTYWRINNIKVKPYISHHPSSCVFINGFTKKVILRLLNDEEKTLILGINYSISHKYENQIDLYFFEPEEVKKNYIDAGIQMKSSGDVWHVTVLSSEDNKDLRMLRRQASEIIIEQNSRNFHEKLELPEEAKKELLALIRAKSSV